MENELKNCPFCGEEISINAKKCKHCGEWLENKGSNLFIDFFSNKKFLNEKKIISIIFLIIFLILSIIFIIIAFAIDDIKSRLWMLLSIICTLWCKICIDIISEVNNNEK